MSIDMTQGIVYNYLKQINVLYDCNKTKYNSRGNRWGDFYPKDEVKSGIQRLVNSFLNSLSAKRVHKKWFYYFFNDKKYLIPQNRLSTETCPNVYFPQSFFLFVCCSTEPGYILVFPVFYLI